MIRVKRSLCGSSPVPFDVLCDVLCAVQMQYKLNERLLAVSHSDRPIAFTDVGDLTGPGHTVHMLEGGQSGVNVRLRRRPPSLCSCVTVSVFTANL